MNESKNWHLLIIMLFILIFGKGVAQDITLGFKGGGATYFGDINKGKITPYAGLSLEKWFADKYSIGLLGYYSSLEGKQDGYYFETSMYWLAGLVKVRPFEKNVFSPYFMGGIEGYSFDPTDKTGKPLPNNELSLYKKQRFGLPVGGGFSLFLNDRFSFDIDALYHFSLTDYLDDLSDGNGQDYYLTAHLGISFHFGRPKDTDGDGIPDRQDLDPLRPEDFDRFQDTDGAPDLDNDEDSVLDVNDGAPMDPEDRDGFEDSDGVPDPDNDSDTILDLKDVAPNDPEDFDDFEDNDGAPDPDNDGDTILDINDECPGTDETVAAGTATKEVFNGYEDDDGCPDKKPEIAVEKGESIVLEGVYFAIGKAELTANSRHILQKVVRTLMGNPKIQVEIRGHTDNTGSYQTNMRLSQQRANAVKIYLMNNGIDARRISTRGYGPDHPIAPNTTRDGRSKNRRIEFFRIN